MSLVFKSPDLNPLYYHVGAILGRYTRQNQCRIKVGAIDAAALGPLLKIGPPS